MAEAGGAGSWHRCFLEAAHAAYLLRRQPFSAMLRPFLRPLWGCYSSFVFCEFP